MQHVVYEVDVEDMVAFAEHYATNVPNYQRQIRQAGWKVGFWLLALAVLGGIALEDYVFTAIFGVLAAYYIICYPRIARRSFIKENREAMQSVNPAHFGRQEAGLNGQHLWVKDNASEITIKLGVLVRVEETKDYVFIYPTPHQAIVVPKQRVISGDVGALAAALGQIIPLKSFT